MVLFIVLLLILLSRCSSSYPIAKPNCIDYCGEVAIPYPFGIGPDCYHDPWYEIICNTSLQIPIPFLPRVNLGVVGLTLSNEQESRQLLTVSMMPQNVCANGSSLDGNGEVPSPDLRGSPYSFSVIDNVFLAVGCPGIIVKDRIGGSMTACGSSCSSIDETGSTSSCRVGIGCCQASLELLGTDPDFYQLAVNHIGAAASQGCNLVATLISSVAKSNIGDISSSKAVPAILSWRAAYVSNYSYGDSFTFENATQRRMCSPPYVGNAYLPNGCQVDCSYYLSEYDKYHQCRKHHLMNRVGVLGLSIGIGLVLLLSSSYWLYRFVKRTISCIQRANYFKKNGGLLLQHQISSSEGVVEKTKIFTISELQKVTNNFSDKRILGQGGQGTVYKGMMSDGKIVAIKKSNKVDEGQLEQFINEVIILSQVNHRNVVKLLGCCLETEVPLLVYEFIANGTLYEHIHAPSEGLEVTWKMRLQIAAESAGALAYLHSSSASPIYHRDIKSSNILLDEKYRAKVSDFGISKAITINQTHVTTCVRGTYGYLDPEYFQSHRFTEKSDVYSFGVVLVELITGKKPVYPTNTGGWMSLASEFLSHIESCHLDDILDPRILGEGNKEEFISVANLARQCLRRNGKRRPQMKEVAKALDEIRTPPNGCNSSHPSYGEEIDFSIAETNMLENDGLHTNMSLPENRISNDFSIEVQPLVINTV